MASLIKKFLLFPPIILAVLVAMWLTNRTAVAVEQVEPVALPVRVVTVQADSLAVSASGFGRAEATKTWTGVAEVEGRLTLFPDVLQIGARIGKDDLMFEIDPRDYEIRVAQAQADVLSAEADLERIKVNAANTEATLVVQREILEVFRDERDRMASLVQRGSVAQTSLDSANRSYLSQQATVTGFETDLALVAPDRMAAEATLAKVQADLESAERDLDRTRVVAPFAGRVTQRAADEDQYVRVGDTILSIEDVASSEVEASFQFADLGALFSSFDATALVSQVNAGVIGDELEELAGRFLQAKVIARIGVGDRIEWPAKLVRFTEAVDEDAGTFGIVVRVNDASRPQADRDGPPLVNGTFLEVVLTGPAIEDALLIPREAVRSDTSDDSYVFVVDADSRLARKAVTLGAGSGSQVVVLDGLELGEQVILSDPQPAVLGALLAPVDTVVAQ
ncbi:efflux RND transporter periplasmic adaptor subunit [Algirhabdus cladophorae]|uniref:efflux RND transporter periplasmic adaptor subunit n=1 Tax=Algirhabdus cladophorae TaxID=3377108 RepID=UPI003B847C82